LKDERKPHVAMITLLNHYNSVKQTNQNEEYQVSEVNAIHSLLGALRNFCVAIKTRSYLLESPLNVIDCAFSFIDAQNLEIRYKSLSIIRLLAKSCTTTSNGLTSLFNEMNLKKLFDIVKSSIILEMHKGVWGETSRLVCYLPIAAKSEANIRKLAQFNDNFIKTICEQLKSDHFIMINEALLALNVLIAIDYSKFKFNYSTF
jgi:hypothetical protein